MTVNELQAMLDDAIGDGFGNCEVKTLADAIGEEYYIVGYRQIVDVSRGNVVKSIRLIESLKEE